MPCPFLRSPFSYHYGRPRWKRFTYDARLANQTAYEWLDGGTRSAGEPLALSANGRNNLFALIHGFRELSRILADVRERASAGDEWLRPPETWPIWARHQSARRFPFHHTLPILDLDEEAQVEIIDLLDRASRVLLSGDVMSVRNRVPHGGGDFPSSNEIQIVLAALDESMTVLENSGLSPTVWHYSGSTYDTFGRRTVTHQNYLGHKHCLRTPSTLTGCGFPSVTDTQVIARTAILRDASESLRFTFEVESDFTRMWAEYPRRHAVEAGEATESPLRKEPQVLALESIDVDSPHRSVSVSRTNLTS